MIRVLLVEDEEMTMNLLKIIVNWEEFQMKIVAVSYTHLTLPTNSLV